MKKIAAALIALSAIGSTHAAVEVDTTPVRVRNVTVADFVLGSIATKEQAESMALKYYEDNAGGKSPGAIILPFAEAAAKEEMLSALNSYSTKGIKGSPYEPTSQVKWTDAASPTNGTMFDGQPHRAKRISKAIYGGVPKDRMAGVLGTDPLFGSNWMASYTAQLFAASQMGGRVLKTWPKGTEPMPGALYYMTQPTTKGPLKIIEWPGDPKKIEAKKAAFEDAGTGKPKPKPERTRADMIDDDLDQQDGDKSFLAQIGSNISTTLLGKKRAPEDGKPLTKEQERAFVFMRSVVFSMITSQYMPTDLYGKDVVANMNDRLLQKFNSSIEGSSESELTINVGSIDDIEKMYKKTWAYNWAGGANKQMYEAWEAIEGMISNWTYVPLSEKGKPVKFAFKPNPNLMKDRTQRMWSVVEFTPQGIIAKPVYNMGRVEYLKDWESSGFQCISYKGGMTNNYCYDWAGAHFGGGYALGEKMVLQIREKKEAITLEGFIQAISGNVESKSEMNDIFGSD